jgi:outer membrane protein TolC
LRYNTKLASTVLPEGFFGPGSDPQQIRFGTTYTSVMAFNATQTLFNARVLQQVKMDKKTKDIEQQILDQVKSAIKLTISEAYYMVLLKKQEVNMAQKTVDRLRKYMEVAYAKQEIGTIQENEANTVKLDFLNANLSLQKSKQALELSLLQLNTALFLNPSQVIELSDSLYIPVKPAALPDDLEQVVENRSEIKQLVLKGEVSQLGINKASVSILPTLSAYANYSSQYQNNKLDLFGKNAWTPFNYVGLKVGLPILNQNASRLEKQQYHLRFQITENSIIKQKRKLLDELQKARMQLMHAGLNLEYAQDNYKLAASIYSVNLKKYELGSLLYTELLDIEKSLREAEKNLTLQTYELMIARLRWQQARGEE